jgi:chemotaxis protein methyltransferase CheR
VTISRFLRDAAVFERLASDVLPTLAEAARSRGDRLLRVWSAGCASGEEPYSIVLLWHFRLENEFPDLALAVIATDVDEQLLQRARAARYRKGSLRELPSAWIESAFLRQNRDVLELKAEFASRVEFRCSDVRAELPDGAFDLVFCRNLVCTYFADADCQKTLRRMLSVLRPGGALVIGLKEQLPSALGGVAEWHGALGIYRRLASSPMHPVAAGVALCS